MVTLNVHWPNLALPAKKHINPNLQAQCNMARFGLKIIKTGIKNNLPVKCQIF